MELNGLFIPAHVDRQAFGLLYHLGFIPPGLALEAMEISRHMTPNSAIKQYPQISGYALIQSGDVHYLDDFLGNNQFIMEKPTIEEIKNAFRNYKGRSFSINSAFDNSLP